MDTVIRYCWFFWILIYFDIADTYADVIFEKINKYKMYGMNPLFFVFKEILHSLVGMKTLTS